MRNPNGLAPHGWSSNFLHLRKQESMRRLVALWFVVIALVASYAADASESLAQVWNNHLLAPRHGQAMAYDAVRGRVTLFGGRGGSSLGDTWEWEGTTWTQRASSGPSPRSGHAMAYDEVRGRVVLFGGSNGSYPYRLTDTWEWDGTTWTQQATSGPVARYASSMAYDASLFTYA